MYVRCSLAVQFLLSYALRFSATSFPACPVAPNASRYSFEASFTFSWMVSSRSGNSPHHLGFALRRDDRPTPCIESRGRSVFQRARPRPSRSRGFLRRVTYN